MTPTFRYVLYVMVSAAAAAGGMILTEIALRFLHITSLHIAVPSNTVGGVFILAAAWAQGARRWRRWPRADWLRLGCATLAIYALGFYLMYEGVARIGSGKAALLGRLEVILVVGLAVLFLGERWSARHWLATFLAVGGAGIVNLDHRLWRLDFGPGEVLILLAALVYAAGIVTLKSLVDRQDGQVVTGYGLLLGALLLVPFALTDAPSAGAQAAGAQDGMPPAAPLSAAWIGAVLVVRGLLLGISWVTYNVAMRHIGASRCSVLFLSVVLFTVALQVVVDGVAPQLGLQVPANPLTALAGGVAIAAGIVLVHRPP